MAQRVQVVLIDDIDGSEAVETVRFGLDGQDYELDLSAANADKLRSFLQSWTQAGRKVVSRRGRRVRAGGPQISREESNRIRAWARANGHAVSDRGRISQQIREAYEAAQN